MKKIFTIVAGFLCLTQVSQAQTKVFKEVGEGISSQTRAIIQDGNLVGYLTFTQLERASEDSFNYKITIMDENLSDLGTVKFREQKLWLQGVSFEQDMLCLAYVKTNFIGVEFKNKKELKRAASSAQNWIFTQFVDLKGKIVASNSVIADIEASTNPAYDNGKLYGDGKLKHGVQIKNIPNVGFAIFYGDDRKKNLIAYSSFGKQGWEKPVGDAADAYYLLTSGMDIFLLSKTNSKSYYSIQEGGYEVMGFDVKDGSATLRRYVVKDKEDRQIKIISFENDPATGKPVLTGEIINEGHASQPINTVNDLPNRYVGVCSIQIGRDKKDIKEIFSYWNTDNNPDINRKGKFRVANSFTRFEETWRDYDGNTYFAGSAIERKPRWGGIISTTLLLPTIVFPIITAAVIGCKGVIMKDALVVRQDAKGGLKLDNSVAANTTKTYKGIMPLVLIDHRAYHHVTNAESKTDYLVIDDLKTIIIYNATKHTIARTIPHKDGNVLTYIYPAKEGHVMVSEYNKKEHTTRWSIEAL